MCKLLSFTLKTKADIYVDSLNDKVAMLSNYEVSFTWHAAETTKGLVVLNSGLYDLLYHFTSGCTDNTLDKEHST